MWKIHHQWEFKTVRGGGGVMAKSCLTLAIPQTVAHQVPLSVRFPRLEYWSGLPFSFPGVVFATQGSTHISCLAA